MSTNSIPNVAEIQPNAMSNSAHDLVFERLPSGDYAWLKPCTEPAEDDEALYILTDVGRRALRCAELFGCGTDDDAA